jgi:hypothetical protein
LFGLKIDLKLIF